MKILVQLTPVAGRTMADFQPHMVEEEKVVWSLYGAGILRDMYFQRDPLVVSLVFEAESHAAVEAELGRLPMMQAGLLEHRLTTLGPWRPLEALFAPEHRSEPHA